MMYRTIKVGCQITPSVFFRTFKLPPSYKPNTNPLKKLPFGQSLLIWYNSLKSDRLKQLQNELVKLMVNPDLKENADIRTTATRVKINEDGNYINELNFEIINNEKNPTKHVVFIHGYGASLGCFARNFQIINKFKDLNYNYKIHFLDNISFGLSSNPRIDSDLINHKKIERCPEVQLNDPEPTDPKKLYNKYYKLVESFKINQDEFEAYKQKFTPILLQLERYYLEAIDNWRLNSGIESIDYLIGHSYGGYWSASYSVRYPDKLKHLILLSPVGVERHIHSIKNTLKYDDFEAIKPTLDPSDNNFLSRIPILSKKKVNFWYNYQWVLPRVLKYLGPWGVRQYFDMWYSKLTKINRLISKNGGPESLFSSSNDLQYGTNKESLLIIEYLYNSITRGTVSDIYIKYLLTPSTISKYPLFDKFLERDWEGPTKVHFLYGQYDFMNSEAGSKLVDEINTKSGTTVAKFHSISESGHNLYIDNPFETNALIHDIIRNDDAN